MNGVKIGIGFGLWKFGLPEPQAICEYAETAEALGLDSIWLSDHIVTRNPTLDITCLFAMIAARTKHVKMGPSVLTLPARHPVHVAKTYAALDYISGGRMIMAVGSGSDVRDLEASGVRPQERGKRLDEGIKILRRLWTESNVTHHGDFYHFDNVTIEPKPRKGPLDIWIGGKSDAILKRVVRVGDGWFPALTSPEEFDCGMNKMMVFGARGGSAAADFRERRSRGRMADGRTAAARVADAAGRSGSAMYRWSGGGMRGKTASLCRSGLLQICPAPRLRACGGAIADRTVRHEDPAQF